MVLQFLFKSPVFVEVLLVREGVGEGEVSRVLLSTREGMHEGQHETRLSALPGQFSGRSLPRL